MEFRKEGPHFVICLNRGEKIIETMTKFLEEKQVKGGFFQAVGAITDAEIGYYDMKKFNWKKFGGEYELISMTGTISETGMHAHISFSDEDYRCHGGHLKEATVAVTLELFLTEMKKIRRKDDAKTGLKFLEL